ncbi:glucose-6-phosphate dehydrogenase [Georgenia sp. EYE_87]|uniref:glucose-6-phosphate dehydrogenase n=1 Tax=Georgenia sp. EYE_87 TaxID=2853448 RepID=UPI002004BD6D|nr:glucose-6-phosphate dehydrogenase [Georgenia sp. EYE_87]MCK6210746.1 glucose-6-phosphate dehydrogenase [Georgenia sp. EYE_87]
MTEGTRTEEPAAEELRTLLVLGASGDLAGRLLLPGLGRLLAGGRARSLRLVGAGIDDWDQEQWIARLREAFAVAPSIEVAPWEAFAPAGAEEPGADTLRRLEQESVYLQADVARAEDLQRVLAACTPPVAIYFALPPAVTERACLALEEIGVPQGTRLVMEKPFGTDAESARHLNEVVARLVPEEQVHRVDHFLGKSTVLNILGFRFANRIFEPVWNASHIARVDIVYDENLGLEGRARYYDTSGALRDMIESHLLHVLALVAMEAPATLGQRDVRDRIAEVLRATRAGEPEQHSRRARYGAGRIGPRELPAYAEEAGVSPERGTETLAEVTFFVDNWRWSGVPFRLRSGKGIGAARKEAVITFQHVPHLPVGLTGPSHPARLRLGMGPERLDLEIDINGSGDPWQLDRVALSTTFGQGELPAYGEVLAGVLESDPMLSVRGDVAEECWRIVTPVLDAWRDGRVPLEEYPAGSDGA